MPLPAGADSASPQRLCFRPPRNMQACSIQPHRLASLVSSARRPERRGRLPSLPAQILQMHHQADTQHHAPYGIPPLVGLPRRPPSRPRHKESGHTDETREFRSPCKFSHSYHRPRKNHCPGRIFRSHFCCQFSNELPGIRYVYLDQKGIFRHQT